MQPAKRSTFQKILFLWGVVIALIGWAGFPGDVNALLADIDWFLKAMDHNSVRTLIVVAGIALIVSIACPAAVWRRSWLLSQCGQLVKRVGCWLTPPLDGWSIEPVAGDKKPEVTHAEGRPGATFVVRCADGFRIDYTPSFIDPTVRFILITGSFPNDPVRLPIHGLIGPPPRQIRISIAINATPEGNASTPTVVNLHRRQEANDPIAGLGNTWDAGIVPLERADGLEDWLVDVTSIGRKIFGYQRPVTVDAVTFSGNYVIVRSIETFRAASVFQRIQSAAVLAWSRGEIA
jgi:hypothetical protein